MKCFPKLLRLPCLLALIGASGCGLSDYEKRMDAQRARVEKFDEPNHLLDDPIEMPKVPGLNPKEGGDKDEKVDVVAWPFDVFLRLPKGYSKLPKERMTNVDDFPCFRYVGGTEGAFNIFVAAWLVADPPAKNEKDAKTPRKYTPDSFLGNLHKVMHSHYTKNDIQTFMPQEKGKPQLSRGFEVVAPYPDPTRPPKVLYTYRQYTDEGNKLAKEKCAYDVYVFEERGKQVGIIVHRPLLPPNPDLLNKSIDACLGSLDVSSDASNKRAQYKSAKAQ